MTTPITDSNIHDPTPIGEILTEYLATSDDPLPRGLRQWLSSQLSDPAQARPEGPSHQSTDHFNNL